MNTLTDSRSCGWWSGAISRSEILGVLLSDHNVVHDLSSSFQLHLQGFVWKLTRVAHENVPPWKILRFERVPKVVVVELMCAIKSALFAPGRTRKTASVNWSLMLVVMFSW